MAQTAVNEAVDRLLEEIAAAWNAGDARAYGARYCPDGTFTNTDGTLDLLVIDFAERGRNREVRHPELIR